MVALQILDVKKCMAEMLTGDSFDRFCISDANIVTGITYVIDGHLTDGYYGDDEKLREGIDGHFMPYGHVRHICFEMIKGRRTPDSFRFTFLAGTALLEDIVGKTRAIPGDEIVNLTLNIRYNRDGLVATTAVTRKSFTMDRTVESEWDSWVRGFFAQAGITVDDLI